MHHAVLRCGRPRPLSCGWPVRRARTREPDRSDHGLRGPTRPSVGGTRQGMGRLWGIGQTPHAKAFSVSSKPGQSQSQFYEWLDGLAQGTLPEGPPVWICGDCHAGNLGPLADADGRVDIQIRDLDQSVIGNPTHDLVRLGLSLTSAARGSDLPGVVKAQMMEEMVPGYAWGLGGRSLNEPPPEPDVVRTVRRRALGRQWKHLARERLAGR